MGIFGLDEISGRKWTGNGYQYALFKEHLDSPAHLRGSGGTCLLKCS